MQKREKLRRQQKRLRQVRLGEDGVDDEGGGEDAEAAAIGERPPPRLETPPPTLPPRPA